MSFDPALFAEAGQSIAKQGSIDKEARTRIAIGRAYYALFLSIRTAIRTEEGKEPHGRGDQIGHGNLTNVLYSSDNPELNGLAEILGQLYEARRQADYVLEPAGRWAKDCKSPRKAKNLLRLSEATIRRLSNIDFTEMKGKI